MQQRVVRPRGVRTRAAKRGHWLLLAGSTLMCAACGETDRKSANSTAVGSEGPTGQTSTGTAVGNGVSTGGASHSSSTASSTFTATASATATTSTGEPAAGGAAPTSTTSQGSAGADPLGPGGAGPDDGCEVATFGVGVDADVCQLETRCVEFVQHTNCRLQGSDLWQCDTDEHDNSKPHTLDGNPFWYNSVTGTADAMQACQAVVDVNLERGSVTSVASDDCSDLILETRWDLSHTMLCGPRYQVSSGATVWDGLPPTARCSDGDDGASQSCGCAYTGADAGEYRVEASDLESALADVWAFCTNSSPRVPVEEGVCDPIAGIGSEAGCEFINNCPLLVTDDSGIELEQLIYKEIRCEPEAAVGMMSCSCRLDDRNFSFRTMAGLEPGLNACEGLAEACSARHTAERADGPAECEQSFEFEGRDEIGLSYLCQVPVSLGGQLGLEHTGGRLVCTEQSDGLSDCVCRDDFTSTSTPLEPAAPDRAAQWQIAAIECEALLEADPGEP